jgi:Uma2 family endonuclease
MSVDQAAVRDVWASEVGLVLRKVPWQTYRQLREEPENGRLRMTYDRGMLEIMSPGRIHEQIAEMISWLILTWAQEKSIPLSPGGSLTVSRHDLERGCEPDRCFFIQHEAQVREREEYSIDDDDPPPDLVIEVDVTSPSAPRMPIYAALGVPEIWRWRGETLEVFVLSADGEYIAQDSSQALKGFPLAEAARILQLRRQAQATALIERFREFVKRGGA